MSKIKSVTLSFPGSDSQDVVGYKLYVSKVPADVNYESQAFDLGTNTSIILNSFPGMEGIDDVYNIGVTAIDDAGNESSMSVVNNVPLDFLAPNPPGVVTITSS